MTCSVDFMFESIIYQNELICQINLYFTLSAHLHYLRNFIH